MEPFQLHLAGRPSHPRVRDVPARGGALRPAGRAQRARRPAGPRRVGLRPRSAVARQPRATSVSRSITGAPPGTARSSSPRETVSGAPDARRLIDAVGYITGRSWADRDRIAIYGGSYGGYAALVGAAFTPDVFRCAVDIVGAVQPEDAAGNHPPYWAPDDRPALQAVGNPETEADFLWSRSPLFAGPRHPDPAAHRPGRQ